MNTRHAIEYNAIHAKDFTPDTAAFARLVATYQQANGLIADGQLGPDTRATLKPPVLVDWIPGLTIAEVAGRWAAMSQIVGLTYSLGAGGRNPLDKDPRNVGKRGFGLDCTGALCYAYGLDRYQPNLDAYGGWCSSDGIVEDALGKQQLWELLDRPVRGCTIVFPGIDFDGDGDRERIGHAMFCRSAPSTWNPTSPVWIDVEIWDCAGSNRKRPNAVGAVYAHNAAYAYGKHTFRGVRRERWGAISVWCKALGRP